MKKTQSNLLKSYQVNLEEVVLLYSFLRYMWVFFSKRNDDMSQKYFVVC